MSTEIKVYWSNNQLWHIIDNADGTISAYYNANCKPCNRVPYTNVATAVKSAGGLDAFKARLITPEEAEARLAALAAEKAERAAKKAVETAKAEAAATEAEKAGAIIPTQANIRDLLLCVRNNTAWPLPKFAVGYSVNRYDCGSGKIAATAEFDKPICINGHLTTRVCLGAPRGHLDKYTRI